MERDSIMLSEGLDWPPHYIYTGERCPKTFAAICEWDGTPLSKAEEEIVRLSQQTWDERKRLMEVVAYLDKLTKPQL